MPDGVQLPPARVRALQSALARCPTCKKLAKYLRDIGRPHEEEERRIAHLEEMASIALTLHNDASPVPHRSS